VARHHHAHVIQCHRSWLPAPQTPCQDEDAGNKCWQGACLPSGGIKHRCTAAIRLAGTQTAPASSLTTVPVTGGQDLAGKLFEAACPGRDGRSASVEPPRQRARLIQSLVRVQDDNITGKDAMVLMGVENHVKPEPLPVLQANVSGQAAPASVIVTTPKAEYKPLCPQLRQVGAAARGPPD
jgi:hypothetical protein